MSAPRVKPGTPWLGGDRIFRNDVRVTGPSRRNDGPAGYAKARWGGDFSFRGDLNLTGGSLD